MAVGRAALRPVAVLRGLVRSRLRANLLMLWSAPHWLAPLQVTCEEIAAAGFWIERLAEPRPLPEAAAIDPRGYERLCREPTGFLAFRLRPRT